MLCRIQHLSKGYGPSQAYNTDLWADPRLLGTASDLDLVKGFLCVFVCFTYLGPVCFVFFCVFSAVCSELSVPVQVIACKDSSLK